LPGQGAAEGSRADEPLPPIGRVPGGAPLPVTGAWQPGQPVGDRRFVHLGDARALALEGGGVLRGVTVAYETWGTLDADGANAVLVCHALTGDSHVAGPSGHGHPSEGWWDGVVGPGRALDTDRWFVVCANVLGGCQGTTGPASIDPATGRPYGSTFPVVSIRDMVRTQAAVADHLGVRRWLAVVGGSMGGMQALEWGVMYPHRARSIVAVASCAAASARQIAWSSVGRAAVMLDPAWRGGDYYDAAPGEGPHRGLAVARAIAQITYRSEEVYAQRFDRAALDPLDEAFALWQRFDVEGYLDYHGAKLVRRFDANSYLRLNKAMDLHDVGRSRGGVQAALRRIQVPVLTMSISSDGLYPPVLQRILRDELHRGGTPVTHVDLDSPEGHDGFLLEVDGVGAPLHEFLTEIEKRDKREQDGTTANQP
jgi:homoserine O-acetyltransferase/O-succinyltransferase